MTSITTAALLFLSLTKHVISIPITATNSSSFRNFFKRLELNVNPELSGLNFPDPSVIQVDGTWYSFATRTIGSSTHIQIALSGDFKSWSLIGNADGSQRDALPDLPPWVNANSPNTWAPDVVQLVSEVQQTHRGCNQANQTLFEGRWELRNVYATLFHALRHPADRQRYFSASTAQYPRKHCIGAATSDRILGPYTPLEEPLICPIAQGGAIDASGYNDNGQRYILYKVDGNAIGHGGACGNTNQPIVPTPIIIQPVQRDGITIGQGSVTLLDNDGESDQGVIEAPSLVQSGRHFVLFFSSGCFTTDQYTVNYATSDSIAGPYARAERPLFRTGDHGLNGPGGMSIHPDGEHMLFHARYGNGRALYAAAISVNDDGEVTACHDFCS